MKCVVGINVSSNAAVVIIREDGLWCALEEERFSRIKHNRDPAGCIPGFTGAWFPQRALEAAMEYLAVHLDDIAAVAFACTGEFPTHPGPRLAEVVSEKLSCPCMQLSHHLAHAWSVNDGELEDGDMITVCDGSGSKLFADAVDDNVGWERLTTFVVRQGIPRRTMIVMPRYYYSQRWQRVVRSINSLGFFYQWMASLCVPRDNELEGSMMALAAFGGDSELKEAIEREIELYPDGGYLLRLNELSATDLQDAWPVEYPSLPFSFTPDDSEACANLAWAAQHAFESVVTNAVLQQYELLRPKRVAVGGGSFLNCVLNGHLETIVPRLVLRPAMHDAGVAYGCAVAMRSHLDWTRALNPNPSETAAVGQAIREEVDISRNAHRFPNEQKAAADAAEALARGDIIAIVDGRNEFGPRALGNRSVFASPSVPGMKQRLNTLKRRASFRPFALAVLEDRTPNLFGRAIRSPFMLQSFSVVDEWRTMLAEALHIDNTVRVQTVSANEHLYLLLCEFAERTRVPALINTSLNEKGCPIAQTAEEAIAAAAAIGVASVYLDFRWRISLV